MTSSRSATPPRARLAPWRGSTLQSSNRRRRRGAKQVRPTPPTRSAASRCGCRVSTPRRRLPRRGRRLSRQSPRPRPPGRPRRWRRPGPKGGRASSSRRRYGPPATCARRRARKCLSPRTCRTAGVSPARWTPPPNFTRAPLSPWREPPPTLPCTALSTRLPGPRQPPRKFTFRRPPPWRASSGANRKPPKPCPPPRPRVSRRPARGRRPIWRPATQSPLPTRPWRPQPLRHWCRATGRS